MKGTLFHLGAPSGRTVEEQITSVSKMFGCIGQVRAKLCILILLESMSTRNGMTVAARKYPGQSWLLETATGKLAGLRSMVGSSRTC